MRWITVDSMSLLRGNEEVGNSIEAVNVLSVAIATPQSSRSHHFELLDSEGLALWK